MGCISTASPKPHPNSRLCRDPSAMAHHPAYTNKSINVSWL